MGHSHCTMTLYLAGLDNGEVGPRCQDCQRAVEAWRTATVLRGHVLFGGELIVRVACGVDLPAIASTEVNQGGGSSMNRCLWAFGTECRPHPINELAPHGSAAIRVSGAGHGVQATACFVQPRWWRRGTWCESR